MMTLVSGICTQCGATVSADTTKDCMICPYCGVPFIVSKAIDCFSNKYGGSNSSVSKNSGSPKDFVIRAGVLERYIGSNTVVVIPGGITAIGYEAFKDCYGLTEVTIPEGVTLIGESAFSWCKGLKKVTFPNSLKEIKTDAFWCCESLEEISLPDKLCKLGFGAFSGCSGLRKAKMPDNKYDYNLNDGFPPVFLKCENLRSVIIPDESWLETLKGSAYYDEYERVRQQQRQILNKRKGLCAYCGGSFRTEGFIKVTEKCSKCGRPKDY